NANSVEKRCIADSHSQLPQTTREQFCVHVDSPRDFPESVRPMVHGVRRCNDGEQHLCGADIRCRLVAADMLLAGLKREPVCRLSMRIFGDAHETSRQESLMRVLYRNVGRVRSAKSHRHPTTLT